MIYEMSFKKTLNKFKICTCKLGESRANYTCLVKQQVSASQPEPPGSRKLIQLVSESHAPEYGAAAS